MNYKNSFLQIITFLILVIGNFLGIVMVRLHVIDDCFITQMMLETTMTFMILIQILYKIMNIEISLYLSKAYFVIMCILLYHADKVYDYMIFALDILILMKVILYLVKEKDKLVTNQADETLEDKIEKWR